MVILRVLASVWLVWSTLTNLGHQAKTGWVWFPGWLAIAGRREAFSWFCI